MFRFCCIIVNVRTRHQASVEKGGGEVKTPSASELLVQVTREAEQRRILEIANKCENLEDLKKKLESLLNSK